MSTTVTRHAHHPAHSVLQRWPTLAAVVFAMFVMFDGGTDLAPVLAAAALVYLGAALLGRRSSAWPLFFGTVVVITAGKLAERATDVGVDITWVLLGFGVIGIGYAVGRAVVGHTFRVQPAVLAMAAYGAVAATAVVVAPTVGAVVVGSGLLAHAAWDLYHYRANTVVDRSLAEFCGVLDALLGLAVIGIACAAL